MSKKLFVGGLSWNTTNESLHECFARFGELIEAKVIVDRETGRSRGFGFVSFADAAASATAVEEMNGGELDGRTLRVNEAEERRPSGPPRSFGGDRGGPPREGGYASRGPSGGHGPSDDRGGYQDSPKRAPKAKDRRERDRARTQATRGSGGGGGAPEGSWNDDWRDD